MTSDTPHFTFEAIKARILKNAQDLWDVPNAAKLDPIVTRLAELLAGEMARLGYHTGNMEGRIMPKVASVLAPYAVTAPRPAHAILHCPPLENGHVLHPLAQFSQKRRASGFNSKAGGPVENLYFTPLGSMKLFSARVGYMASGTTLSVIDGTSLKKTAVANAKTGTQLPPQSLWLGLEIPDNNAALDGLTFYFEWPQDSDNSFLYDIFPLIRAHIGLTEIPLGLGIPYQDEDAFAGQLATGDKSLVRNQLIDELRYIYHNKFLHCTAFPKDTETRKAPFPEIFRKCFTGEDLAKLGQPLLWLQLYLPPGFTAGMLDGLKVYTNAVPVANCRYRTKSSDLVDLGIVPLMAAKGEGFLSEGRVSDDIGRAFTPTYKDNGDEGSYRLFLREKPRFDERSIRDLVRMLPEQMVDEHRAFNAIGHGFLKEHIKKLEDMLAELREGLMDSKHLGEGVPAYVVPKLFPGTKLLTVGYWATQHTHANGIPPGTKLEQSNVSGVKAGSLVLLTGTHGGRTAIKESETADAYTYWMLTSGSLVTNADITAFCKYELGSDIRDVRVGLKLLPSGHPKQGFARCLCVTVTPSRPNPYNPGKWAEICGELRERIRMRGAGMLRYDVSMIDNL